MIENKQNIGFFCLFTAPCPTLAYTQTSLFGANQHAFLT